MADDKKQLAVIENNVLAFLSGQINQAVLWLKKR